MLVFSVVCWKILYDTVVFQVTDLYKAIRNVNHVVVDSVIGFVRDTSASEDSFVRKDITKDFQKKMTGRSFIDIGMGYDKVEVRYTLNRKKYRLFSSSRIHIPYTMKIPKVRVKATDVKTGIDYSERIAKYAGPWGDFHGVGQLSVYDLFPSWEHKDVPEELYVVIEKGETKIEFQLSNLPISCKHELLTFV